MSSELTGMVIGRIFEATTSPLEHPGLFAIAYANHDTPTRYAGIRQ